MGKFAINLDEIHPDKVDDALVNSINQVLIIVIHPLLMKVGAPINIIRHVAPPRRSLGSEVVLAHR